MTVTFGAICSLLQSVENISRRQPRLPPKQEADSIREIITDWFSSQRKSLDDTSTNGCAVLSMLFPHRRKDLVYGLQAPLLAKKLTTLLAFNHSQKALFNGWNTGKIGDLGAYVERAMAPWDGTFAVKRTISIDQVDQLLVQLAAKYRFSDEAIRKQRVWHTKTDIGLKKMFVRLESWEAKWLVRLILRDYCTIEQEERYVLQQYHFLLPDLLMFQNDFAAVFNILRGELSEFPATPVASAEKALRIQAGQQLNAVVGIKVGRPTFHKAWSFKHCFQLVGKRAWAAEVKYDGEYCEIHFDLNNAPNEIKIFSKNGKDATADRELLHSTIRAALRIGRPDCKFRTRCIVLGEMVLYSDKEKKILPFSKIRKHISRSGSFIGIWQDSLPHEWEHLMIVFFDVLVLDIEPILRQCLQDRRKILRDLVHVTPGRAKRSEWTLLDFKTSDGMTDLKQVFARNLADRQEGLVLKPLHAPYFALLTEHGHRQAGFFIKVKKDYLCDMGGERDLGDFAVIGASLDAQIAPKMNLKPLYWTHFHLGCCMNMVAVHRTGAKPMFKVVATLSVDKCIPKSDVKYLNIQGYVRQTVLRKGGLTDAFTIENPNGYDPRITVAFKKPFVAEILGGGFEMLRNETFEMLRHPRVMKVHHDRTWEDCVTMEDLEHMAEEKWKVPDAHKLDGHARDVAVLAKKYAKEKGSSQVTATTEETTQQTTQRTMQETAVTITPIKPRLMLQQGADAGVQETQQQTYSTVSTSRGFGDGSTQGTGVHALRELRILIREDTSEKLANMIVPTPMSSSPASLPAPLPADHPTISLPTPTSIAEPTLSIAKKRSFPDLISPPAAKRRKILSPLPSSDNNRNLDSFDYDSQEGTIHIYAKKELKVQVHVGSGKDQQR